jgi:TetR/AcrR family fatty acid metabolism transcriptional regulator
MRSVQGDKTSGGTFTEQARRAQILRCAVEAIAELGYPRASLAEIARRAGVSKGVVSYYFDGKEDLLTQLVLDVYMRVGAAIRARLEGMSDPTAAVDVYIEANLAFLASHPADLQAVMEVVSNLRDANGGLLFRPREDDPVLEHLADLLRSGQRLGELREFDPRSVALTIRASIDAAAGRLLADPGFDVGAYSQQLTALVGRGIEQVKTR